MQSTASTWFCTTCGAANDVGQSVCFSCKRARVEAGKRAGDAGGQDELLHGRYRLLTQVGVGGFGEVYKALDTSHNGRVVAIKQINLRGLSPQKTIEATDTFNRELHILSPLKHSGLPRIYDHFTDPDHWYLVMEFLEGETLERYLEERQKQRSYGGAGTPGLLPLEEVFELAFQLCDVLDYLHSQQPPIIFRDLKPANMMRSNAGHVCLIDFGIARFFTHGRLKDTTPLGSPGYAAPEQYGKAQTTARSDLYSLGALLHYLLTGDDPSETPFQFAPLPQGTPEQAGMPELEMLIQRMVHVDSSQRPASAREVKAELQRVAHLVVESAAPRIWLPPPGLPPDPEVEGAFQQQIQIQVQKHKTTTRRKFIRRGLLTGSAVIVGGGLIATLFSSLLNSQGVIFEHSGPGPVPSYENQGAFSDQQSVMDIALSPDGKRAAFIATGASAQGGNGTGFNVIQVYQIDLGGLSIRKTRSPILVQQKVNTLAWSPVGTHLALGGNDGSISIWNTSIRQEELGFNGANGVIERLAWSPDGTMIAASAVSEVLRISRVGDGSTVSRYVGSAVSELRFLSWSPDSSRVVCEYDGQNGQAAQKTLQVWDVKAGKTLFTFGDVSMLQVSWSPDGNVIAAVGSNRTMYLFKAGDGTFIKSYAIPGDPDVAAFWPVELLWSPDSKYLVLDNHDIFLRIWNMQTGSRRLVAAHLEPDRALIWLSNEQLYVIDGSQEARTIDVSGL